MRVSTVPAYLTALQAALVKRPGLANVRVWSGDPGQSASPASGPYADVTIYGATADSDWALEGEAGASPRDERYEILADILTISADLSDPAGALHPTEYTIQQVRGTAYAYMAEVDTALRTDPGLTGLVNWSDLHHARCDQGALANGSRWCIVAFSIRVRARI